MPHSKIHRICAVACQNKWTESCSGYKNTFFSKRISSSARPCALHEKLVKMIIKTHNRMQWKVVWILYLQGMWRWGES